VSLTGIPRLRARTTRRSGHRGRPVAGRLCLHHRFFYS